VIRPNLIWWPGHLEEGVVVAGDHPREHCQPQHCSLLLAEAKQRRHLQHLGAGGGEGEGEDEGEGEGEGEGVEALPRSSHLQHVRRRARRAR
jgi:hypothetical protein